MFSEYEIRMDLEEEENYPLFLQTAFAIARDDFVSKDFNSLEVRLQIDIHAPPKSVRQIRESPKFKMTHVGLFEKYTFHQTIFFIYLFGLWKIIPVLF